MSFQRQSISLILQKIEYTWQACGAASSFIELMHGALPSLGEDSLSVEHSPARWALLPGICCQAAGGNPRWADDLAAAWLLYYVAAHIMDKVEDQDVREGWRQEWGDGTALNVASGLYFSASLLLTSLFRQEQTAEIAEELVGDFYRAFLRMCSGQHHDLVQSEPTLSEYWDNTNDKSGVFFSVACRLGARIATPDKDKLRGYEDYGRRIGVLIQVLDDLEEYQGAGKKLGKSSFSVLRRSLPAIYALDVLPDQEAKQLSLELKDAPEDRAAGEGAFQRIEKSGAVIYILAEIERHRSLARTSLDKAQPLAPATQMLFSFLESLTFQS